MMLVWVSAHISKLLSYMAYNVNCDCKMYVILIQCPFFVKYFWGVQLSDLFIYFSYSSYGTIETDWFLNIFFNWNDMFNSWITVVLLQLFQCSTSINTFKEAVLYCMRHIVEK